MLSEALYILLIIVEIVVLGWVAVYAVFLVFSWLKGAPYVATAREELNTIFERAGLKQGMTFIELGCGDGRVTRYAVQHIGVKGIGIDINPILILIARFLSYIKKVKNITFIRQNVLNSNLSSGDVIYIYLFPLLVQKLKHSILDGTKRPVTIIAHGFAIDYLKEYKYDEIKGKHFKTHYYLIKDKS